MCLALVATIKAGARTPSFVPIVYGIADRVARFRATPRGRAATAPSLEERP
jgi:hypothetical protein